MEGGERKERERGLKKELGCVIKIYQLSMMNVK